MPYKCKGKCDNEKSSNGGRNAFTDGRKMCSTCMKYIKTDELRCYCCGAKMRIKATRSKSRAKRLETVARY